MSLPAYDDFNRSNGSLGSNWSQSVGNALQILSNMCTGTTGDCSMYWSADTPDADQYAQIEIRNTGAFYRGTLVRGSSTDFVVLSALMTSGWDIEWYNGGAWTQIGSTYNTPPAVGDTARIEAEGSTFRVYINGVLRISGSNASAPSSGYGGVYAYENGARVDNFEVGNLSTGVVVTPDTATAVASSASPTTILGSLSLAPGAASAASSTTAPGVILGSLSLAPGAASAISSTTAPGVIQGSLSVSPEYASAIAGSLSPSVIMGSVAYQPYPSVAIASTIDPYIPLNETIITPDVASAIAESIEPDVILREINLTPSQAVSVTSVYPPEIVLKSPPITPTAAVAIASCLLPIFVATTISGYSYITAYIISDRVYSSYIVDIATPDESGYWKYPSGEVIAWGKRYI